MGQDDPARSGTQNLTAITAQSVAPVSLSAAEARVGVDFGFNFDTVVVRVSPPDKRGYVSLGSASDLTMLAIKQVKKNGGRLK